MHREILTREQHALLPLVKSFAGSYYLAGGTAIALQIGHRRSIDFDLFTRAAIKPRALQAAVQRYTRRIPDVIHAEYDQLHLLVKGVKFTFMTFPFDVPACMRFEAIIALPSLPVLGAMKAFAFGGRAKWKDYVDMYFLLKYCVSLDEIVKQARHLFGPAFNAKLFRGQLAYFKDIDYREAIDYVDAPVADTTIKRFLARTASAAI